MREWAIYCSSMIETGSHIIPLKQDAGCRMSNVKTIAIRFHTCRNLISGAEGVFAARWDNAPYHDAANR